MTNKRNLKKCVKATMDSFYALCWLHENVPGSDKEKVEELMEKIETVSKDLITRLNHPEPGNTRGFYKKFHSDFCNQSRLILDELAKLD